jgi:4-amino-4-deoxy-L-arabinose transferase-like glycosyltransferase
MGGQVKAGILKSSSSTVDAAPSRSAIELEPTTIFALTAIAAAALYLYRLGTAPLGASEGYSAWAAAMPSPWAIIHIPVPLDPGKQVLYYILLHYFTGVFGMSEASLRALSPLFAIATLPILFTLARTMFDDPIAASAVVLWAFNPVILLLARRARMYPMLAAVALAHFMLLWLVRRKPSWPRAIACGFFGALAVYTHLAALFLLGAEAAMLVRDFIHGRRNAMAWLALAIALVLFLPYFPIFSTQSDQMVHGHWLDWISTGYHLSLATKVLIALGASAISIAIVFGPRTEDDPDEPLRWCLAWGLLPVIAFLSGTAIIRPMFHIRYLIPCVAMVALIVARVLEGFGSKVRNLSVVGITVVLLVLVPVKEITNEPWRDIAALISARSPQDQPIFFESGFLFFDGPNGEPNNGFPNGYYRNAFDFYFRGNNPRVAIPGWDSAAAKRIMTERIAQSGGGWLVSWKSANDARLEFPDGTRTTQLVDHHLVALYHIEPASR